jgi:PHD/YefM family antitoxin component YafN of YafNO toxin-antitoxin module
MDYLHSLGKTEARKNFLSILNDFASGVLRPILVTDHGKAQAVILPYEEYKFIKTKLDNLENSSNKKEKISIFGDSLEIIGDLENYSVWDQCKDEWEANWDKLLND